MIKFKKKTIGDYVREIHITKNISYQYIANILEMPEYKLNEVVKGLRPLNLNSINELKSNGLISDNTYIKMINISKNSYSNIQIENNSVCDDDIDLIYDLFNNINHISNTDIDKLSNIINSKYNNTIYTEATNTIIIDISVIDYKGDKLYNEVAEQISSLYIHDRMNNVIIKGSFLPLKMAFVIREHLYEIADICLIRETITIKCDNMNCTNRFNKVVHGFM